MVGWIGDQLLVQAGDDYQLVGKETLRVDDEAGSAVEAEEAAATVAERPVLVGRGKDARIVRATDRKTLFKAPLFQGIYGFDTNADASLWVIYLGESDYLVCNPVTKKKVRLPSTVPGTATGFSAWKVSQDGAVIGEVGLPPAGVDPESEEAEMVGRTLLYRFDLETEQLQEILLPAELEGKAIHVLDSGRRGHLFVTVSGQRDGEQHCGAYVLQLVSEAVLVR